MFVFWGGREGTEVGSSKDPRDALERYREAVNVLSEYVVEQGYDLPFAIEPKPNEPRGDIFLPTVGHALHFISMLDRPERVGVNPEVAHETMAGLSFLHGVGQALWAGKLFHIDLNGQRIGRYDQDFRFGAEDLKEAFHLVRLLERAGYDGPRHFDAHAYRSDDADGVWDFAAGCMRTYRALAERAAHFDSLPQVQEAMAAASVEELGRASTSGWGRPTRSRPRPRGSTRSPCAATPTSASTSSSSRSCSGCTDRGARSVLGAALGRVQRGVAADDEIVEQLVGPELDHADADAGVVVVAGQLVLDLGEAPARVVGVGARERADELVAAVADDRVERAQLGADRGDDALQERVAGEVAVAVVERLEPVHVDEGQHEPAVGPAGAIDLVLQRDLAHLAAQRTGEVVVVGVAQLDRGAGAIVRRRLAVVRGGRAILGGARAVVRHACAQRREAPRRVPFPFALATLAASSASAARSRSAAAASRARAVRSRSWAASSRSAVVRARWIAVLSRWSVALRRRSRAAR